MGKQLSFYDLKLTDKLSDQDKEDILAIVSSRCREKTKRRLRSMLFYSISAIGQYGIFSRLIKENGRWSYVAGQSYPDEIRTLRKCILNEI